MNSVGQMARGTSRWKRTEALVSPKGNRRQFCTSMADWGSLRHSPGRLTPLLSSWLCHPVSLSCSLSPRFFLPPPCPQGNNETSKPPGFRGQTKTCSNNRLKKTENQDPKLNWPGPQGDSGDLRCWQLGVMLANIFFSALFKRTHRHRQDIKIKNVSLKILTGWDESKVTNASQEYQ